MVWAIGLMGSDMVQVGGGKVLDVWFKGFGKFDSPDVEGIGDISCKLDVAIYSAGAVMDEVEVFGFVGSFL